MTHKDNPFVDGPLDRWTAGPHVCFDSFVAAQDKGWPSNSLYWLVGGQRNGRQLSFSFLVLKCGFDSGCLGRRKREQTVVELNSQVFLFGVKKFIASRPSS